MTATATVDQKCYEYHGAAYPLSRVFKVVCNPHSFKVAQLILY